jgi:hypothetical protein
MSALLQLPKFNCCDSQTFGEEPAFGSDDAQASCSLNNSTNVPA